MTDAVATVAPVECATARPTFPTERSRDRRSRWLDAVQFVAALGISPAAAVRGATGNAARAIGATDYGRIAPGARADVLALDPETLAVRAVWIGGRAVGPE